ncbi:MAG: thiolase family protein [Pseudomonadota bacterium]
MNAVDPRKEIAVVGVGSSRFGRDLQMDKLSLIAEAFKEALDDSGLRKEQVDGLIVNLGVDCDLLPMLLGMDVRYAAQTWPHARLCATVVHWAGMAAVHNTANYVACIWCYTSSETRNLGSGLGDAQRVGGGPHFERPEYGMIHPGAGVAMATRRYFELYGSTSEQLGAVAVAHRKWAALNPKAVFKKPITIEDYLNSPFLIEPLRLLDFSPVTDSAVCIIVSNADRAKDCRKVPVYILGLQGMKSGREHIIMAREGLSLGQQRVTSFSPSMKDIPVYGMAGITPEDVDCAYIYDAFSVSVLFTLEEFGFCPVGEAANWIQDGRIEPKGELPVNTNGGNLSECWAGGWAHIVEAVRQVRNECGERQVRNAEIAQFMITPGVAIVFGR